MRRKVSYNDFQVRYTPERLKHFRRTVDYCNRDRRRKGAADLVVYRLVAPVPEAAGRRIAFISDLHYYGSCFQKKITAQLAQYLQEFSPELLLLGGDVCCDADTLELIPDLLKPLSRLVPRAIAGPGNWERGKSWISAARWRELFSSGGFELGFNEFNGAGVFQIYCADDPSAGNPRVIKAWQEDKFRLLLAHRPDTVIAYDDDLSGSWHLALCGHTHGGQIRLPFFGSVFAASIYGCALDYGCFEHTEKKSRMIVSSGLGHMSFPWRINCRREMILIEFTAAEDRGSADAR